MPEIPDDEKELYLKIKEMETKLNVIKIMKGWKEAVRVFERASKLARRFRYFLLELDILREKLDISIYTKNQEQQAIQQYTEIEKKNMGKKEFDVVLVGADNLGELKRAYPNYFVNSDEFLSYIQKIISKY